MRTILLAMMMAGCAVEAGEIDAPQIETQALSPTGCASDAACDDGNACTTDRCVMGACRNVSINGCVSCSQARDCFDGDPCTEDLCVGGVCEHPDSYLRNLCGPDWGGHCHRGECCEGWWDLPAEVCVESCDDGDACTADIALNYNECGHIESTCSGPCACETHADCDTGNPCVQSACVGDAGNMSCVHMPLAAGTACEIDGIASVCNGCACQ